VRLFIAVNVADYIRTSLHAAADPLRRALPGARWVAEELLHLTIKFIGEQDKDKVPQFTGIVEDVAAGFREIPYAIGGIGAFPTTSRPSVVWVGVQGDAKLELLSHDVESRCAVLGVPLDGRPFRPHITLGRVKHSTRHARDEFEKVRERIVFSAETAVTSLDLMVSEQLEGRLRYRLLHAAALRPAE
jgi:2'-5' RNA ligase